MAFSVALTAQGVYTPPPHGDPAPGDWIPDRTKKPYRWAHLTVTQDTTAYATGGLALNVLGALTKWEKICGSQAGVFTNNGVNATARLVAANHATPGNRLVQLVVCSTGAEVGNSVASTAGTWDLVVWGY